MGNSIKHQIGGLQLRQQDLARISDRYRGGASQSLLTGEGHNAQPYVSASFVGKALTRDRMHPPAPAPPSENAMANGAAVKLPIELSPLPDPSELENLGDIVAAAAIAIGGGCGEFAMNGQLSAEAKMAGAEALTRVSMLQLSYFGDDADFAEIALREGKRALWRHGGFREYAAQLDQVARERMFEVFLQGAIEIAGKAAADERARAQH
jgi:hypothetical protein